MDEELPVRLEQRGWEVFGFNLHNSPYPVGKIIIEGRQIAKEEYDKLVAEIKSRTSFKH